MTTGVAAAAISEFTDALYLWDFSPAYPSDYPATSGVIIGHGWPYQLLQDMEQTVDGQMTEYLITVLTITPQADRVRLGSHFGAGAIQGQVRHGHRVTVPLIVTCWADQRLGGLDGARKMGDQVWGCALANEGSLPSWRHLKVSRTSEAFEANSMLYHFDVEVEGSLVASVDY